MQEFPQFPPEILYKIMSYLDRETLLMVSRVCRRWRMLVHALSHKYVINSLTSDSQQTLDQEDHDWYSRKCISIHLDCFPYRHQQSRHMQEDRCGDDESFQQTCAITDKFLFIGKTSTETVNTEDVPGMQRTDILVYNRHNPGDKPRILKTFHVSVDRKRRLKCNNHFIFRTQPRFICTVSTRLWWCWRGAVSRT